MMKTYDTPSRIPVRTKKPVDHNHNRTVSAPSKLERLAEEYQQRIILEKQEKLLAIYNDRMSRTLDRVQGYQNAARNHAARNTGYGSAGSNLPPKHKGATQTGNNGTLRDFFNERRQLEQNPNANRAYHSNINVHYRQARMANGKDSAPSTQFNSSAGSSAARRPPLPKKHVGRDKAYPLQPLDRQVANGKQHTDSPVNNATVHSPKPPPFEKKPKMIRQHHRRGSQGGFTSGSERELSPQFDNLPSNRALIPVDNAPKGVKRAGARPAATKQIPGKPQRVVPSQEVDQESDSQDSSLPGSGSSGRYQRWKQEQQRMKEERQRSGGKQGRAQPPQKQQELPLVTAQKPPPAKPQKLTDFQKWQQEQDDSRTDRLQKYSEVKTTDHTREVQSSPDPNNNHKVHLNKRTPSPHRNLEPLSNKSTARTPKRANGGNKQGKSRSRHNQTPEAPSPEVHAMRQRKLSILKNTHAPSDADNSDDSSDDDEDTKAIKAQIKAKEHELRKMIAKQQQELTEIRKNNLAEEENERREKEQEARRLAQQKARQKALRKAERTFSEASHPDDNSDGNSRQDSYSRRSRLDSHNYDRHSRRESHSERTVSPEPVYKAPVTPKPKKQRKPVRKEAERVPTPTKNENTAFYLEMATTQDAMADNVNLVACPNCGRKFAEERLAKHAKVCQSASKKARKVFDPSKMRTEGTEMAQYQKSVKKQKENKKPPKTNWRAQHKSFVESIRYAKKVTEMEQTGGNLADLPPPPVTENPDYVQCPHCERTFNPGTAERHIPRCKDIKARPAPPKKGRR